jgi:transposase-like protein
MPMPGLTACPFCKSLNIRTKPPVHELNEYECKACHRSWLVAHPKHEARVVAFPTPAVLAKRHAGANKG